MKKTTIIFSITLTCLLLISLVMTNIGRCSESVVVKENIRQLKKYKKCRGCDLSGANLTRFDLSGADLEGADLSRARCNLTNLSGANLKNADLNGTVFGGADLGGADLRGADLRGVVLESAYLGGTLLDGKFIKTKPYESEGITDVEQSVYIADQSRPKKRPVTKAVAVSTRRDFEDPPPAKVIVKPKTANSGDRPPAPAVTASPRAPLVKKINPFKKVEVKSEMEAEGALEPHGVKVKKIVVEDSVVQTGKAVLPEIDNKKLLLRKDASSASKKSTAGKRGRSADPVVDVEKKGALQRLLDKNKCYGCDLSGLDLSGADLEGADLEKADLRGCNLEKTDLEEANLKGARLVNANLRGANLRQADLYRADLSGADLEGANLKDAYLDNTKGFK